MPQDYELASFFRKYKFKGEIQLSKRRSYFDVEIFEYDSEKGLFIASGKDERGLSAIIGNIKAKSDTLSKVRFTQFFNPTLPIRFRGDLMKTSEGLCLNGSYINPKDDCKYPFELDITLRWETASPGWRDQAIRVVLPTTR